jgi:hypothetical protein
MVRRMELSRLPGPAALSMARLIDPAGGKFGHTFSFGNVTVAIRLHQTQIWPGKSFNNSPIRPGSSG